MRLTLAITTYERPDALAAVLRSLGGQTSLPDEVIVADDGSGESTRAVIEQLTSRVSYPVHHVRQDHKGFRVARLRNLAIAKASSEYIVFIDHDMVLHPEFIADHRRFARRDAFTQGVRIPLDTERTAELLRGMLTPSARIAVDPSETVRTPRSTSHDPGNAAEDTAERKPYGTFMQGMTSHGAYSRGDHIPVDPTDRSQRRAEPRPVAPPVIEPQAQGRRQLYAFHSATLADLTRYVANAFISIKSCNQGFWREDLVAVNGFEEEFVGWGSEDKELCARLGNYGVARQTLLFGGIAFHLYHPPASRDRHAANERLLERSRKEGRTRAAQGLDAHLNAVL